jgi:hypothetical protein
MKETDTSMIYTDDSVVPDLRTIDKDEKDDVIGFVNSARGNFIISQALYYAIKELDKITDVRYREESNIHDMKYLLDNAFDIFPMVTDSDKTMKGDK